MSKLWDLITIVRDMGGTIEDVRALMQAGAAENATTDVPVEKAVETVENPDGNLETPPDAGASELEALRLENARLKGQLQTYNILHMSTPQAPAIPAGDAAVQVGIDMIK